MDLALNNLQGFICHKMQPTNQSTNQATIRRRVHEDIRYKSYLMKRGQFISEKSKENHLNISKRLLNKHKDPAEAGVICCVLFRRENF